MTAGNISIFELHVIPHGGLRLPERKQRLTGILRPIATSDTKCRYTKPRRNLIWRRGAVEKSARIPQRSGFGIKLKAFVKEL